jgi:hypothetical protein
MIKASFLQKQAGKYRELARAEVSLEMRRQLFALAARCDELAATMARWPGPKDLGPAGKAHIPAMAKSQKKAPAGSSSAPEGDGLDPAAPAPLLFPERRRATRIMHSAAE